MDIDGTLNYDRPTPSPANVRAVRDAQRAGHLVLLCTGRSMRCIPRETLAVGFDGVIAGGGADVRLGDRRLSRTCLSEEALRCVCRYYLPQDVALVIEGEDDMFYMHEVGYRQPDWKEITAETDFSDRYAGAPISKITADGQLAPEGRALLEPYFEVIQHPTYMEALPRGCCKSGGIRTVLETTGIPRERAMGIGDSMNDADMIDYVGIGVAMGNACDELKKRAKHITLSSAEDGVAAAIRRYIPGL